MIIAKILNLKLSENVTHDATDWQISTDILFNNIVAESIEDHDNKTSISFDQDTDVKIKYYGRARLLLSTGYTKWSNIDVFIPVYTSSIVDNMDQPTVVPVPMITTDSPQNTHVNTGFIISATGFGEIGSATHVVTDWWIEDIDGYVIWEHLDSTSNLNYIVVDDIILKQDRIYRIRVSFGSSSNDKSQTATYTINTGSNKEILLITNLISIDYQEELNLEISYIAGIDEVSWSIKEITQNGLVNIWNSSTIGNGKFTTTVAPNILSENRKYILMIKTNNNDAYFTQPFSTF